MSSVTDATNESGNDDSSSGSTNNDSVHFEGVIDVSVLDVINRHMTELVADYTVVLNECGWHIRVTDRSNVVQFDVRLGVDEFEQYELSQAGVIGVSHTAFEDMTEFAETTDGEAYITVENNTLTVSDGERLFWDTALINPDSIRQRPERPDMEFNTDVTFTDEQMWDFKKFVRSNKGHTAVHMDVNHVRIQCEAQKRGDVEDTYEMCGDTNNASNIEASFSVDYLYNFFKSPLKAQLTGADYTFVFAGDEMPMKIVREMDNNSKFEVIIAPRKSR
jgi:hypothetical protein